MAEEDPPEQFSSRLGLILTTIGAAVGTGLDVLDRVAALVESNVDIIVVDTAHGHSENVINTNPIISNGSLYILTENSKIIGFN